jgi:hypothetical protein
MKEPPQGGFFISRGRADEQGACAPCGWDSKLRAYSRAGGLQHVGESHRLRQVLNERATARWLFHLCILVIDCKPRQYRRSLGQHVISVSMGRMLKYPVDGGAFSEHRSDNEQCLLRSVSPCSRLCSRDWPDNSCRAWRVQAPRAQA